MARFYCLICAFALLFPYITSTHALGNDTDREVVKNNLKSECIQWFYHPPISTTPLIINRDHALTLIDVVALSRRSFREDKTLTLKAECRSVYPSFLEVTWGQNHENGDSTGKSQWTPINGSVRHVFNLSMTLKINVSTTEQVRVSCRQKFIGKKAHASTFKFLLFYDDYHGKSEVRMEPDATQEAIYVEMAHEPQTLTICSPMQPLLVHPEWIYKAFGGTRNILDIGDGGMDGLHITIIFLVGILLTLIPPMVIWIRKTCKNISAATGRNRQRRLRRRATPHRRVAIIVTRSIMPPETTV